MHNARFAESILSLFTSRERAASTVGDLMEGLAARGRLWFWTGVFQIAFSHIGNDLAAKPGYTAGLLIRGWLVGWVLLTAITLPIAVCRVLIAGLLVLTPLWPFWERNLGHVFEVIVLLALILSRFQLGRWLARRAQGREIAVCAAFLLVDEIIIMTLQKAADAFLRIAPLSETSGPGDQLINITMTLLSYVALISGGMWVRRRHASY